MSIDISVLIWTIFCFLILLFFLTRFLFRPLLKIMHDRQDKIDAGIAAGEAAKAEYDRLRSVGKEAREEQARKALHDRTQAVSDAKLSQAKLLSEAGKESLAEAEAERLRLEKEEQASSGRLSEDAERLARILADKLITPPSREQIFALISQDRAAEERQVR